MAKVLLEEKKIEALVGRAVQRAIFDIFGDPDSGRELSSAFEKKLKQSVESSRRGRLRDFDEVIAGL